MAHIVIIGAGISGLTTAWYLQKKGHRVTLLEKKSRAGGPISTVQEDGWIAEEGPGTLLEVSEHVRNLIQDAGLENEVLLSNPKAKKRFIAFQKKPVSLPSSIKSAISTPLLHWNSKLRFLKEPFIGPAKSEDETLADFVRRRLGAEALERFINPLVGGIYAGDPERLSARYAFPRLWNLEQEHKSLIRGMMKGGPSKDPARKEIPRNKARIINFKKGLNQLPESLSKKIETVEFNAEVTKIRKKSTGFSVSYGEKEIDCDVLVYAGRATGFRNISLPKEIEDLKSLDQIVHPPVCVVHLGFRRSDIAHPLDGFGVLIPAVEKFDILGTQFNSSLFPNRTPGSDFVLTTSFVGGMRQPEMAHHSNPEELVLKNLTNLLGIKGKPVFSHHKLWPKAIPQYEMDYGKYALLMDDSEKALPGFYLAGNYRGGISLGDSITNAVMLSERIDASLQDSFI